MPKQPLLLWTESRFCFKPRTPITNTWVNISSRQSMPGVFGGAAWVPHERDVCVLLSRRVGHSQSRAAEGRLPWPVQGQRGNDGQDLSLWSHPVHGF